MSQFQKLESSHQSLSCLEKRGNTHTHAMNIIFTHCIYGKSSEPSSLNQFSKKSATRNQRSPYLLLEPAATYKSSDQSLNDNCCSLLLLLPLSLLSGLPGFVQELGLGALRYTKHRAPWEEIIQNRLAAVQKLCMCSY